MSLPNSYTQKPAAIPAYFEAILNAQPPERFSHKFLEKLGFKSTNDRLLIGILKDIGFLDSDGKPTPRYFKYLDRSQSEVALGEGIKEAFSDLFAVRTDADVLGADDVQNKLRTLYAGSKSNSVIGRVAATFVALCAIADFSSTTPEQVENKDNEDREESDTASTETTLNQPVEDTVTGKAIGLRSLQYHINIIMPESRDQAVYDALFKSLKDHLG